MKIISNLLRKFLKWKIEKVIKNLDGILEKRV